MHPSATHFQPTLFAHGRLLWRHEGSDGARLSPKLAWRMVERATAFAAAHPGAVLWDPFCGTGLLPTLAALFFAESLSGVRASDVEERAVATTRRNLALVTDPAVAERRQRQILGFAGQNAKSEKRWGEVADYLDALTPRIHAAQDRALPVEVLHGPAHALSPPSAPTLVLGDAPYGRSSQLIGPPLAEVLAGLARAPEVVWVDVIVTPEQARAACSAVPQLTHHPAPGGRCRVRYPAR